MGRVQVPPSLAQFGEPVLMGRTLQEIMTAEKCTQLFEQKMTVAQEQLADAAQRRQLGHAVQRQSAPARFEAGTGNIAAAVGLGAALDWLTRLGLENVAAWERELLAKPAMQLSAAPVQDALDDHIYFSKEAATGGRSFGGGGCGCN